MQVVRVSLAILGRVALEQPIGPSALARALNLPKSTVQRHLKLLAEEGWLVPAADATQKWQMGPAAQELARRAPTELGLRDVALPVMRRLAESSLETVYLAVPTGDTAVLIERVDSPQPVRTYNPLGTQIPLHGPATGKAILAHLTPETQARFIASALPAFTPHTVQGGQLREQLQRIRVDGFAVNVGEWRSDVVGIASPILDGEGRPLCSIGISMPVSRHDPARLAEWGSATAHAAAAILAAVSGRDPLL